MLNAADDLFAPQESPAAAPASGYVLCDFAGVTLAVPQADIVTIEHGGELAAPLPGERALGWFSSAQGPWPAYALDAQLQPLTQAPARSFLVFVHAQPTPAGLLCDSVRIVRSATELPVQPLPAAMRQDSGPVQGIARIDPQRLALILREGALAMHFADLCSAQARYE